MKKNKTKKILIILLILILIGILSWFLINKTNLLKQIQTSPFNPFPFGQGVGTDQENNQNPNNNNNEEQGLIGDFKIIQRDRFRKLTNYGISGYKIIENKETMLSQKSIILFNEKRGNTRQNDLENIDIPVIKAVKQSTGFIYTIFADNNIREYLKAVVSVPNHYESFVLGSEGNDIVYRYYDEKSFRIQSFIAQGEKESIPDLCQNNLKEDSLIMDEIFLKRFLTINNIKSPSEIKNNDSFIPALKEIFKEKEITTGFQFSDFIPLITNNCKERVADYLSTIESTQSVKNGNYLSDFISQASPHPDKNIITGVIPSDISTDIIAASGDNPKVNKIILKTYFSEWIPQWVNDKLITLTTAASNKAEGFIYGLDPATGKFNKILGDKKGLTTLTSPSGRYVLYSESTETEKIKSSVYDTLTNTTYRLGKETLAEKCVWSIKNEDKVRIFCAVPRNINDAKNMPDDWYKEVVSFNDYLWAYELDNSDGVTLRSFPLQDLSEQGTSIDAIKLQVNNNDSFIFFVNKNDNTLWSFELDGLL